MHAYAGNFPAQLFTRSLLSPPGHRALVLGRSCGRCALVRGLWSASTEREVALAWLVGPVGAERGAVEHAVGHHLGGYVPARARQRGEVWGALRGGARRRCTAAVARGSGRWAHPRSLEARAWPPAGPLLLPHARTHAHARTHLLCALSYLLTSGMPEMMRRCPSPSLHMCVAPQPWHSSSTAVARSPHAFCTRIRSASSLWGTAPLNCLASGPAAGAGGREGGEGKGARRCDEHAPARGVLRRGACAVARPAAWLTHDVVEALAPVRAPAPQLHAQAVGVVARAA